MSELAPWISACGIILTLAIALLIYFVRSEMLSAISKEREARKDAISAAAHESIHEVTALKARVEAAAALGANAGARSEIMGGEFRDYREKAATSFVTRTELVAMEDRLQNNMRDLSATLMAFRDDVRSNFVQIMDHLLNK